MKTKLVPFYKRTCPSIREASKNLVLTAMDMLAGAEMVKPRTVTDCGEVIEEVYQFFQTKPQKPLSRSDKQVYEFATVWLANCLNIKGGKQ